MFTELYFLMAKYLSTGPCQRAAQVSLNMKWVWCANFQLTIPYCVSGSKGWDLRTSGMYPFSLNNFRHKCNYPSKAKILSYLSYMLAVKPRCIVAWLKTKASNVFHVDIQCLLPIRSTASAWTTGLDGPATYSKLPRNGTVWPLSIFKWKNLKIDSILGSKFTNEKTKYLEVFIQKFSEFRFWKEFFSAENFRFFATI